jgi:hypothetical protein
LNSLRKLSHAAVAASSSLSLARFRAFKPSSTSGGW